eukprot:TRINITY_DN1855_c0_g1_i1.p1 TRINITY_DN1855_c0_g1~~TRINITY_DN1855_c0_g1_i1.p1  ORF type:complete len:566 (-),score=86.16 TRINITY_DN1855_c0_g1_i1:641-2338(-)
MSSSPHLLSLSDDTLTAHDDALCVLPFSQRFDASVAAFASNTNAFAIASSPSWTAGRVTIFTESEQLVVHTAASSITKLALSAHARFVAVAYADNTVQLLNVRTHQSCEYSVSSRVLSLSFDSQTTMLSVCTTNAILLLSLPSLRQISEITPTSATRSFPRATTFRSCLTSSAISPLHPLLASSDDTGCVTVYDISSPSTPHTHARFTSALRTPATTMCFSSTGVLAVAGFDKHIRLYDSHLKTLLFSIAIAAPATALAFREHLIAVATTNSTISLIEADVQQNSFVYNARYETSEAQTTALLLCPPCVPIPNTNASMEEHSPEPRVDPLSQTFSDVESFLSRLPPLPPDKQAKQTHTSKRLHARRSLPIISEQSTPLHHEEVRAAQLPAHLSASFLTDEQASPPSSTGTASPVSHAVSQKDSQHRQHDVGNFDARHCSPENSPLLRSVCGQGASSERRRSEEFFNIGAPVLRRAGVGSVAEGSGENEAMNMFRSVLRQEMDVIRSDLHNDIVSIHSELVLLASAQSKELKEVLKERDETVVRLEREVLRLKADNMRLRKKYGLL